MLWRTTICNRRLKSSVHVVLACGAALCSAAVCSTVQAQVAPGTVSPIPGILPPVPPTVRPGTIPPGPQAPAEVSPTTHNIQQITVVGVSAYSAATIAKFATGLVGTAIPESSIEQVRASIVDLYRRDGYVYTAVSAVISGSNLQFIVTEGHIVEVKLDGDIGTAGTQVLRFLNHLTSIRPIDEASLERWLLLASDVPGISVRSVLNPVANEPGALSLVAQVSRAPVSGLLTSDNRAFKDTGPEEALAVLDFNSFSEFGERNELQLYHTFNETETFGQASTEFFVGDSGLRVRLYGGQGAAVPSGVFRAVDYSGRTTVFGGQMSYPLLRTRPQNLNLSAFFDAIESRTLSSETGLSSFDSLRVMRTGLDYTLLDVLLGPQFSATNTATLLISQGLPALGASRDGDPNMSRKGAHTDFTKFTALLSRTQTLYQFQTGQTVALQTTIAGQAANSVLPSEEEFFLGGPRFNRGFYYGQVTGDNAMTIAAELQYNTRLPVPGTIPVDIGAQFYTFYDWGATWQNRNLDANTQLNSTGGGVRLFVSERAEVDLEGVWRITRNPNGNFTRNPNGNLVKPLDGAAFYWQVLMRF